MVGLRQNVWRLNVRLGGWDWRVFVERANGVVKIGVDSCVKGRWKETR